MRIIYSRLSKLVLILVAIASVAAEPVSSEEDSLYRRCLRSSVWIVAVQNKKSDSTVDLSKEGPRLGQVRQFSIGSGSIIDLDQRLVLTNCHVVGDCDRPTVFFPVYHADTPVKNQLAYWHSNVRSAGKVIVRDQRRDLAIIQVEKTPARCQALSLADHDAQAGEQVYSIGNGGESRRMWTFRSGPVNHVIDERVHAIDTRGDMKPFWMECRIVHIDMKTEHGESGSPIFNDKAELVGVLSGMSADTQFTYAVDIREVRAILSRNELAIRPAKPASRKPAQLTRAQPETIKNPDVDASRKLKLARQMIQGQRFDNARRRLEEIVRDFPETSAAADARALLDEMKP
jgi:S1-C subfamily serine protease